MKKRTTYRWMGATVLLVILAFAAIYLFNLQNRVEKAARTVDRNGPPVFSHTIYGDFDNPLDKPMDVAKIGEFIYVSDTNNKRVQVFDLAGTSIFKFGKEGEGEGEFKFPYGIAGDEKGNVYVADLYNGNISIFDSKGKFIEYFKEMEETKAIKAPGAIRIVEEKIYVTDIEKNKIFVFNLKGEKLNEFGQAGLENGQLRAPNAIAVDKDGNIYVSDTGNQRIQIFDKDGQFVRAINGSKDGVGSSTLVNPRGIAVDTRGIVYIVNNLSHFVYGFDKNGEKVFEFGGMGDQNEQFYLPNGLVIDENDQIYITDTLNQRVVVYY
ncbi:6-bladed beta-propeller [Bacillus sp. MRMR6]|uniref:6-bladed beta-propeller n=1 Tax=Bacillus sp. MRMR6 TaxID=1928617 RepID=UPI000952F5CD|nr:6-bladed beta-propeller [Bacillus sp. MRMR6]OLS37843.1 6-bladed beta-propeller [Bacillus sp. MRMR6]